MTKIERQAKIIHMFENAIKKNRLSHLYLFAGPKGSGKKDLAYEIAARLLNDHYHADMKTQLMTNGHINLMFIEPSGQNIKKEQIAQLQTEFSKTSLTDGSRIYMIDEVDKLSTSAANGLLKFLEEPLSKKTIGFLLTDNPDQVINTIISRSQVIYLKPRSEKELTEILLEEGYDPFISSFLPYLNKDMVVAKKMAEDPNALAMLSLIKVFHETLLKDEPLWFMADERFDLIRYDRTLMMQFSNLLMIYYLDFIKAYNGDLFSFEFLKNDYDNIIKTTTYEKISENLKQIQTFLHRLNYNISIDMAFSQLILDLQ
ncbi:DNA polymerase III, delta prime subunit [Paracholeplasma brassicae]|uniref:DNA polymerase III, delta prime subunit n=1 Tax=Acholeplasma brassicae TaxID=61635 RepID=U4KQZ6_9MOLU|nr:AAA family ATPase [Paracholeplasma brassicae]CCV65293.1 DNA polymerase III, delta prime subunit [Paracholeplasma brassicae]